MKRYSETLVQKLEHKNVSLEFTRAQLLQTNRELFERTQELADAKTAFEARINELEKQLANLQTTIRQRERPRTGPT